MVLSCREDGVNANENMTRGKPRSAYLDQTVIVLKKDQELKGSRVKHMWICEKGMNGEGDRDFSEG